MADTNETKNPSINDIIISKRSEHPVLLITLKKAYQSMPQYSRYLKREYESVKNLQHENILRAESLKEVEGYGTCIVTEWQDARTLAEYLNEGHTEDEKKRIIKGVASALQYMHENEVKLLCVHLRYTDNLKRPADELKFIAPETKDGTVAIDARADIFSLGVLIKEMSLGTECQQIAVTCTHFGRNERYTSVEEFLEAFDHPRITKQNEKAHHAMGSNKQMAIIVAVIGVLVIVTAALLYSQNSDSNKETQASDTEMADSTNSRNNLSATHTEAANTDVTDTSNQRNDDKGTLPANQYNGDNAYLNDIVPQMQIDLDKIYNSSTNKNVVRRRVKRYYRGLRATLKDKTTEQLDAFDKAFADYNNSKK